MAVLMECSSSIVMPWVSGRRVSDLWLSVSKMVDYSGLSWRETLH